MPTDAFDRAHIRSLLENIEVKIVLDSPKNDYRFEYFTASIKDRDTGEARLNRTYRLLDLVRGGIVSEPWDVYSLESQATVVANLIKFSQYRITKLVSGWKIVCPSCGHIVQGKIWQTMPKKCIAQHPKCSAAIDEQTATELPFSG
jgi:hypothetical protein